MNALLDQLKAARNVSTPLLSITTPDQPALMEVLVEGFKDEAPIIRWDRARGFVHMNEKGTASLNAMMEATKATEDPVDVKNLDVVSAPPDSAMRLAVFLPEETIVVTFGMNRYLNENDAGPLVQAISNLRDLYMNDGRTLLLLDADFELPAEIRHDVIPLDDPLPTNDQYGEMIKTLYEDEETLGVPSDDLVNNAVRSVRGLSAFEAGQVIAMSLSLTTRKGGDPMTAEVLDDAWDLKRRSVGKIKGLTMTTDGPALSDLRGLDQIISTLNALWLGPEPPELVVRVDEIDKAMAGLGSAGGPGDNTGVSQDLHEQFLVNLEDNEWNGAILVGIRGAGKTILTQAIGAHHNVPTIAMDSGSMKGKHVGDSESAFRDAFRTIKSIGGKNVLVLATANNLNVLPPELLRRFKLGIHYFDLPSKDERDSLWCVYLKKYGHSLESDRPNDEGFTGSEIRNCCELAFKLQKQVKEVGEQYIVPVIVSDPDSVEELRNRANNRFLSSSYSGRYLKERIKSTERRKMKLK